MNNTTETRPAKKNHDFNKLLTASMFSNLSDGMSVVLFPLLAAAIGADPMQISIIVMMRTLPWLFFSLPVGYLIDRFSPKLLMIIANIIRSLSVLLLAGLAYIDMVSILLLSIIGLLIGILEVFFDISNQSYVPKLVAKLQLTSANSKQQSIEIILNKFLGAPIAGFIAVLSFPIALTILSVTFLIPSLVIALIQHKDESVSTTSNMVNDIKEGMSFVLNHRILRVLAFNTGYMNIGLQAINTVFVLFILEQIKAPEWSFGLMTSVAAVGGLFGIFVLNRIKEKLGTANCLRLLMILMPITTVITPLYNSVWVVAFAQFLLGISLSTWAVLAVSYRQAITPPELIGRVNAFYRMIAFGALPVGSLLGGYLVSNFGYFSMYMILSGAFLLPLFALPLISNQRMQEAY